MESMNAFFNGVANIIQREYERIFSYIGEDALTRIRDRTPEESWFDRTGNLRSSIGYAIYDHGKSVFSSDFKVVKNGIYGAGIGKKMVESLASKYARTFVLVIVAAMDYADFVEAMENKDVLASTYLWAKGIIDNRLKMASTRIDKEITKLSKQMGL